LSNHKASISQTFSHKRGNFKNALIEKCKNIKNYPESLFFQDKHVTVLYDAYPKAKYHLLIVPNDLNLINFSKLNSNHKTLLEHMNQLADEISKEIW
jgi:diadenosine tetraphosphate (Ap4A) HIT family hydrolase